ncbi:sugar phosphate isomerase/epimerase family protein [uncultured Cyclobacterium sp.]|uniref:sugar phosphate isomerase/epimerase family protein n=1 Tax=uncultured Cyclobacterium sp. TaxID=453820 RepID=UPI0030EB1FD2|tara:strand:+ start:147986 stop:148942 length:957 start_codon:yes stop_codon:yes gene_type:complete
MKRRKFLSKSSLALLSAGFLGATDLPFRIKQDRKFKIALNPGIIGVKANLQQTLDYAITYGYESISPFVEEVMQHYSEQELAALTAKMATHNIGYGSTNIPVEYRNDKRRFLEDFKMLEGFCKSMEIQGATRINTWIISSHKDLPYRENMKQHAFRLGECAKVMEDHGIRLGLEYLGTRPLLNQNRYPFVANMKEGQELINATGQNNVGFVLDSFHWYTANDSKEDILQLKPEDIVVVDINDARSGFTRETQRDGKRELPLATGVIDLKSFLEGLVEIGYDGPVRTEPFNQALDEMENEAALKKNKAAIIKALALVGM